MHKHFILNFDKLKFPTGNENNFESSEECQNKCSVKTENPDVIATNLVSKNLLFLNCKYDMSFSLVTRSLQ